MGTVHPPSASGLNDPQLVLWSHWVDTSPMEQTSSISTHSLSVGHLRVLSSIPRQARTLLLNRWLVCLTGSSILVLKLTFSPDPFPCNLPLTLNGLISRFYPARVWKSLALKTLVNAVNASSAGFWAHFNIVTYLLPYLYCHQ